MLLFFVLTPTAFLVPGRALAPATARVAAPAPLAPLHRRAAPRCAEVVLALDDEDEDEESTPAELKSELLDIVDDLPDRGLDAEDDDVEDIFEIIEDLEPLNPWPDFARATVFSGTWRLLYTSSKTFHTNMGLLAYSRDVEGVETPELLMKVRSDYRLVNFEEPITFVGNSVAKAMGGLVGADTLVAECSWRPTNNGIFSIESQKITAGSRSWVPADRQAKGIRAVSACTPIYLDQEMLITRGQVPSVVFVWEKVSQSLTQSVTEQVVGRLGSD